MEPPRSSIVVSSAVLSQLFLYLSSLKVDPDRFLRLLSLDPDSVRSPDAYIPVETYLQIQEEAAHLTNDPCFGLHMGEYFEAGSWSILGYLMMNCGTLGEAFEKSSRYSRIIGNVIDIDVKMRWNKIRVVFSSPPHAPEMSRHCYESAFSSTVRLMRTLTGSDLHPVQVAFHHPEPDSISEYARIFRCPVLFGQKENSISMDIKTLYTPVLIANPVLLQQFEKYAQDFLANMEHRDETVRTVTKIILSRLDKNTLSIRTVAKEMAISVRTLQTRLAQEGVLYSDLLEEIRERLAKKYLGEKYSAEQITYLLGYSDPSVFRKAFKKWSGNTPKEYRETVFPLKIEK